ncbi:FUSC family protein [Streptomyces sp. BG9H]|uniref:FUSC family protein n=1 Tax=Streptomyces anatolicus TaxID=2675858 RepID=A0ABS6YUK9_9ACTN|nr:FUSC family protein [Streptomyces anatolicus]MBW5425099.1 FUSC family protein [Streptomyces anatolicus]
MLRPGKPSDIWFKPACSVVVATAIPNLTLLALGRLDLVMYTMAGSFCALYAHNLPYAARARALAWVVAGMSASVAVALVTASLTGSAAVLVALGALLAAAQKTLCDATRIGPPGHLIFTFISSATLFAPQGLGQVPGHLALTLAGGAVAWLVGMAPALVRPHGPERRATARALAAVAAYAETAIAEGAGAADGPEATDAGPAAERARAAAAGAVHAAWQSLLATGAKTVEARRALARLVIRAEEALAAPTAADPAALRSWAAGLRGTGAVPRPGGVRPGERDELLGVAAELAGPKVPLWRRFAPGSPLLPLALRTAVGCALAGYGSLALGVGRPYWALVTAASLYQANVTLTWNRGVQRVVGNLVGVLAFAAIAPFAHLGHAELIVSCLALAFGAEALISRNYWLGTVCVTPMALLVTEFARFQQPGELILDRVVDTLVGAVLGVAAAVLVTNRRAADQIEQAVEAVDRARERAEAGLARAGTVEPARRGLTAALVELRAAADAAAGEWWPRALPEQRVIAAERAGHRTLAATVRRQNDENGQGTRHRAEAADAWEGARA